jgi:hypothetical protein
MLLIRMPSKIIFEIEVLAKSLSKNVVLRNPSYYPVEICIGYHNSEEIFKFGSSTKSVILKNILIKFGLNSSKDANGLPKDLQEIKRVLELPCVSVETLYVESYRGNRVHFLTEEIDMSGWKNLIKFDNSFT